MHGIGWMARESGLTVSALRFYDSVGVLVPTRVDPHSGYRWYSEDQVLDARLSARLRRVGMPLREIGQVLERQHDAQLVDTITDTHLRRLEDGLADARRELSAVRSLIKRKEQPMHASNNSCHISVWGEDLAAALRAVRYAVSADIDLPMLGGVLLDGGIGVGGDALTVVATDRYRLALATAPARHVSGPSAQTIAPIEMIDELIKALGGQSSPVDVRIDATAVTVNGAGRDWQARGLDYEFPDYRRLLPASNGHRIPVDTRRLRAAVVAAPTRILHRDQDDTDQHVVVFHLDGAGGLSFEAADADAEEVGVNREFLLQALDSTGEGQLTLDLDGPIAPLAIRPAEPAEAFNLLMPTRLN